MNQDQKDVEILSDGGHRLSAQQLLAAIIVWRPHPAEGRSGTQRGKATQPRLPRFQNKQTNIQTKKKEDKGNKQKCISHRKQSGKAMLSNIVKRHPSVELELSKMQEIRNQQGQEYSEQGPSEGRKPRPPVGGAWCEGRRDSCHPELRWEMDCLAGRSPVRTLQGLERMRTAFSMQGRAFWLV